MTNVLDLKHSQPAVPATSGRAALALTPEPVTPQEVPNALLSAAPFLLGGLSESKPIEWEARHTLSERGRYRHYVTMAGIALLGGVVAWWQSSWVSFFAIALGLATWELHERFARPMKVRVDAQGLSVDGYRYSSAHLASFDMHELADGSLQLSVVTRHWHLPRLAIPLGDQDPGAVHSAMLAHVPQQEHFLHPLDHFIKR